MAWLHVPGAAAAFGSDDRGRRTSIKPASALKLEALCRICFPRTAPMPHFSRDP